MIIDYRLPENRRQIFWDAYFFHLKYRSMAGFVYDYIPFLQEKLNWSIEDSLWFCFLNGLTQSPTMSYYIMSAFPCVNSLDEQKFKEWYFEPVGNGKVRWQVLIIDMDRRHYRNSIADSIAHYRKCLKGETQEEFFTSHYCGDKFQNFDAIWKRVYEGKTGEKFYTFGRLSSFSYLEYLFIAGMNIDCSSFFAEDHGGSKSHRSGMAKLLGRDDLDEHSSNPSYVKGQTLHTSPVMDMLGEEMEALYAEALERFKGTEVERWVSRFTLETQLCNFKSWFRKSRRYPNVYADMAYDRLVKTEASPYFKNVDFSIFWEARKKYLPTVLRPESYPANRGVTSYKQNLYRLTGRQHTLGLISDRYEGVPAETATKKGRRPKPSPRKARKKTLSYS